MKNFESLREQYLHKQRIISAKETADILLKIKQGLYPNRFSFPIGIQFELTSQCNLNCKHCYNNSSVERFSEMRTQDWLNIVQDIIDHEGIFQCILSGGEHLLL